MLGVRREGVSAAASNLQKRGIIEYRRGLLTVIDRNELERRSCECYGVVLSESDRLLQECRFAGPVRADHREVLEPERRRVRA